MAQSHLTNRSTLLSILPLVAMTQAARRTLQVPAGRCLRCKDRPDHYAYDVFDRESRRRGPPTPEDLARCACGFEPLYIEVQHVDAVTGEVFSTAEIAAAIDEDRYEDWWWSTHQQRPITYPN